MVCLFAYDSKKGIKLPVPITNAETMLYFLNFTQVTSQKLLHQWLAFSGPHSIIS